MDLVTVSMGNTDNKLSGCSPFLWIKDLGYTSYQSKVNLIRDMIPYRQTH